MDPVKYPQRAQQFQSFNLSNSFAFRSFISSEPTKESPVHSFDKEILKKTLQIQKLGKLKAKHGQVLEKVRKISSVNRKYNQHMRLAKEFKDKLNEFKRNDEKMQASAVTIQRCFRGFITRKRLEEKVLPIYQQMLNKDLKVLAEYGRFCLFFIGKKCLRAVVKIQRFYRRVRFLIKIKILKRAYEAHEDQKEINRSIRLRLYFSYFHSKILLQESKENKEFHLKLKKIRQNLAILKIKSKLKQLKLKLKTVRYRIKRYSKRFNSVTKDPEVLSPFISFEKQNQYDLKIPNIPILHIEDSIISHEKPKERSIERFSHSTEYYIAQDAIKKEKIDKGRIVYGIKKRSPSIIRPIFSAKHENRPQTTSSLTIRMALAKPQRNSSGLSPKPRSPGLRPKKKKLIKRYSEGESPPYMRPTLNFKAKFEDSPVSSPSPSPRLGVGSYNKIRYPTFSYTQKMKSFDEEKEVGKGKARGKGEEKGKSRPGTGTGVKVNRRVFRSEQISCSSFIDFRFEPPVLEVPDMQMQMFRPFYYKA